MNPAAALAVESYPYRARALLDGHVVAESASCLSLERPGQPSLLYFPEADIDLGHFSREGTDTVDSALGSATAWRAAGATEDTHATLTILTDPRAPFASLRGHGTFDLDDVRMEVVDGVAGGAERDVTVKEFPTWGDARHLIELLDVRADGELHYVGPARTDGRRPVVEGSQMLAQAIVAASRHVPGRRVVSASMIFLRGADAARPLQFAVDELSSGRTFSGLAIRVLQGGRCCAAGTLLLDVTAPDIIRHEASAPDVPGPYECPPFDMAVTGRDLRVVDGAYTNDPGAPVGPPVIDCWVRFREVPDDPALHAALLAQFTGHASIAAALRPHAGVGQDQAHRTLSMGINAINLSLHREVHADRWMLYRHLSTFAGDGMTHAECRVHDEEGNLLASFGVDAMVRAFGDPDAARDERHAL